MRPVDEINAGLAALKVRIQAFQRGLEISVEQCRVGGTYFLQARGHDVLVFTLGVQGGEIVNSETRKIRHLKRHRNQGKSLKDTDFQIARIGFASEQAG